MVGPSNDQNNNNNTMVTSTPHFTCELQQFNFKEEAIDVALRKLLAKVLLPKESQLIDRALEDFAVHYHKCNPTLADSYDPIYAIAFSILLLHTDAHNKNVKRKMNKDTFIMHTKLIEGGETVYSEVLDIMYDNIVYSEFSYAHDQQDKSSSWFSKKTGQPNITLLHDLYPKLEQLMPVTNTFSYKSAPKSTINVTNIQQSIEEASSVLLAGVRSRQQQQTNGNETFLAKVCKAGIVERKYDLVHGGKRAPARGWRPFGMVLSGSQIMFFGDLTSFQSWMNSQQQQQHTDSDKSSPSPPTTTQFAHHPSSSLNASTPTSMPSFVSIFNSEQSLASTTSTSNLTFLPSSTTSLTSTFSSVSNNTFITATSSSSTSSTTMCLRPIQIVSLTNAICVYDKSYRKYPHVFRLITGDGQQFLIRGDTADDMDDWIQKINYVSAMKTTGVRLRPKTRTIAATGHHSSNSNSSKHLNNPQKPQQVFGIYYHQHYYPHHDGHATQNWIKRERRAKAKVLSLSEQLEAQQRQLTKDEQLRNQLMLLVPMQKTTKDRLLLFADSVGKRLVHDWIILERLACYREIIEWELFLFYQSFNSNSDKDRENLGNSGKPGGRIIPRKLSAPLPFYSGLSLHGQSASTQQKEHQQPSTTTNNTNSNNGLLQSPLILTNDGRDDDDGDDGMKYPGVRIPRRSTSLLVTLSGNTICKSKHMDDLTTTNCNSATGNRRQSCPRLDHLLPRLEFDSASLSRDVHNGDGDQQQQQQQQGSTPRDAADETTTNGREGMTGRLLSQQQRNRNNPFLTGAQQQPQHTGKDGIPSLQILAGNKKTHGRSMSDATTYDHDDNDNDDDDDDGFVVTRSDNDTPPSVNAIF